MPLSPDAKALLELILARGQSYGDIASLLEVPEDEVRSRARGALTELAGADPDRNVALTDWVLGQADPITRADVARHVREDADDHRLAGELIGALREISPEADLPKLPGEPAGGRFSRRAAAKPAAAEAPAPSPRRADVEGPSRRPSLSSQQSRLLVILGSAAVLGLVVVLAVAGVFSGDDDSSTASTGSDAGSETTAEALSEEIQTVPLTSSGGGDAEGTATFGIASGSQAFVDLEISQLEPAPAGKAYVLWLMVSEDQGHPLTPFQVSQEGTYSEQIPIASFLTQLAARTRFVDVSLSPRKPLLDEVAAAADEGSPIINYTGESILRGGVEATGGGAADGGETTTPQQ
jgi:Anti-sigma-K factor rskA